MAWRHGRSIHQFGRSFEVPLCLPAIHYLIVREIFQKSQALMREHKRRPGSKKEGEEALGQWLNHQITAYNKKTLREDRRVQFEELRNEFPDLIKMK